MRTTARVLTTCLVAAGVGLTAPPAQAAPVQGMSIDFACADGTPRTLTRANGASWWDSSGRVYVTTSLEIASSFGPFTKQSGSSRPRPSVTCTGTHVPPPPPDWTGAPLVFTWTVTLAPTG